MKKKVFYTLKMVRFNLIIFLVSSVLTLSLAQPTERPFISVWKTDNPGLSGNNQVKFPGVGTRYTIVWEQIDNSLNNGSISVTGNVTITFPVAGTYRLKVTGPLTSFDWGANPASDQRKLISVEQWGDIKWTDMWSMFSGAENFELKATDTPDLTLVSTISGMFRNAKKFNSPIGNWNTSNVKNFDELFAGADLFNQDISSWNVSNVTNMRDVFGAAFNQNLGTWNLQSVVTFAPSFAGTAMSPANYAATLLGWSNNSRTARALELNASGIGFEDATGRTKLINDFGWKIYGDGNLNPSESGYFITTWKSDNPGFSESNQVKFPGTGTFYKIQWEEVGNASNSGTISGSGNLTITFSKPGTYRLKASGGLTRFTFQGSNIAVNDRLKLLSVEQWGSIEWSTMASMFENASNFELKATDNPNLNYVKDLTGMFVGATKFNSPIGSWDISNVRNISSIFQDASSFNQDLSRWDVSKIAYFNYVFLGASSFNQNLASWSLESAISVIEFFNYSGMSPSNYEATLTAWANNPKTPKNLTIGATGLVYEDATARTKLINDFSWKIIGDSRLNPPESGYFITTWKTDNPGGTTSNQIKFPGTGNNYKIQWEEVGNSANTGSVLGSGEQILNLPKPGIYRLKVSGGIYRFHFDWDEPQKPNDRLKLLSVDQWGEVVWATMHRAFLHAENFELKATDAPDLTLVRELSEAFRGAKKFNSPIGHWKTSTVINYGSTFQDAILFNQDISSWDVIDVYSLNYAFTGATAFNQNLGLWKLNRIDVMEAMFKNSGMSPANYDATLLGWSKNPTLNKNKTLGAEGMKYCSPTGREILERDFNWKFTGDQPVFNNPLSSNYEYCLNGPSEPIIRPEKFPDYEFTWYSDSRGTQQISNSPEPNTTTAGNQQFFLRLRERSSGCSTALTPIDVSVNSFRCNNNVPSKDLVAYYPLKGDANDASPNDLDGQLTGPESAKDRFGKENGAYFFKTGQKITIPSASAYYIPEWTVAAWVNTENINGYAAAFSLWSSDPSSFYWIGTYNGKVNLYTGRSGSQIDLISSKSIADGLWHHIAGTFSNGVARLYVDGILDASGNVDFITPTAGIPQIGNDYKNEFFGGIVDDVVIYKRAFSNQEITDLFQLSATSNDLPKFTWMGGDQILNKVGIYGVKGISSVSNWPGTRNSSVAWSDASDNLWVFGGYGFDRNGGNYKLNDLWKYSIKDGTWTWVDGGDIKEQTGVYGTKGTSASGQIPGARDQSVSWKDSSGNFWLFGGEGYDQSGAFGLLNDLWKYNPTDGKWTWMGGDNLVNKPGIYGTKGASGLNNIPGSRRNAVSWVDNSGNFWLFGGEGFDKNGSNQVLNDFWKYSPAEGTWTWVGGSDLVNQPGVYGTKGTASASNIPGPRDGAMSWTDASGSLWLFGGFDDLWKYSVTNGTWTWVGGTGSPNQVAIYGLKGIESSTNNPGSRAESLTWVDQAGNLWLYGGAGHGRLLNDLWRFNTTTEYWTWMGGQEINNYLANYGPLGIPAIESFPGRLLKSVSWKDSKSNFWFFGGTTNTNGNTDSYNTLWRFAPGQPGNTAPTNLLISASTASEGNAPGTVIGKFSAFDFEGGPFTFSLVAGSGDSDNGSFTIEGSELKSAASFTFATKASYSIRVKATDPGGLLIEKSFIINIIPPQPTLQPTNLRFTNVTDNSFTVEFTGVSPTPQGYIVLRKRSSTIISNPVDGTTYSESTVVGDAAVAFVGSASRFDQTGLEKGQTYYYKVFAFNGSGSVINYNISNPLTGSQLAWQGSPENISVTYTWMSGSNIRGEKGTYGTKGLAAPENVPGNRLGAVTWRDSGGNLWLFGGEGSDKNGSKGLLNDLWKYDLNSKLWTWVSGSDLKDPKAVYGTKGVTASSNVPSGRYRPAAWIDTAGDLWLFGGFGFQRNESSAMLNDIWKYNIQQGTWTWVGGTDIGGQSGNYGTKGNSSALNFPGGRTPCAYWRDSSGNFWLFGGSGHDKNGTNNVLNDLWKFNPSSATWTWISGSEFVRQLPVFGTKGVASINNVPGARDGAAYWFDSSGNLWIFGGFALDKYGVREMPMNDLWKFTPVDNSWTWVSGDDVVNQPGIYGTKGVPAQSNTPGSRGFTMFYRDSNGNFWLLAGAGFDGNRGQGILADLWRFTLTDQKWTWISGVEFVNILTVFGAKGISSPTSIVGSRSSGTSWSEAPGDFWFFGGGGFDVNGYATGGGIMNDLWKISVGPSSNINTAPTGLNLSATSVTESLPSGTSIGTFSSTDSEGGTFTYSLVSGDGSTDNASFNIDGSTLKTTQVFDFEKKTSYSIRIRTTDSGGLTFEKIFTITINNSFELTDTEGNQYNTIIIGTQEWMTENLKVSKYRNGDIISNITDPTAWVNLSSGAFCYPNNEASFNATYGKLYNWFAATDARGVCPSGWKIPNDNDWNVLTSFLGGENVAGGKMKATVANGWQTPNNEATNESGFSGLPSGSRKASGVFDQIGATGYWWTSTEIDANNAWTRVLANNASNIFRDPNDKKYGHPLRCIKESSGSNTSPTDIQLSSASITESQVAGTTIGTFTSVDKEVGPFTYTLVSGEGSTDNASFTIDGSTLKSAAVFNAKTKSSYSIRVRTTDSGGLTFEKAFTIYVLPSYLPSNGLVGWWPFNGNAKDESGNGNDGVNNGAILTSDRNGEQSRAFEFSNEAWIQGSSKEFPNKNSARTISLWYRGIDLGLDDREGTELFGYGGTSCGNNLILLFDNPDTGSDYFGKFEIQGHCGAFRSLASQPTPRNGVWHHLAITFDGQNLKYFFNGIENAAFQNVNLGTEISDNSIFTIGKIVSPGGSIPWTEGRGSYDSFKGKIDDFGIWNRALTMLEIKTLYQTNNIAPTALALTTSTITEGFPSGSTIGTFSTTDAEGGTFIFSLVPGEGSTDNSSFTIDGSTLKLATTLNAATKSVYTIRVRVTDSGGLFFEKSFTLNVLSAEPTSQPTSLSFSNIIPGAMTVSFTAPATAPSGYLVLRKKGGAITAIPQDGTGYDLNATLGDATVVYNGSVSSFNESSLEKGSTYYYVVFAYNGSGSTINYNNTNPLAGQQLVPLDILTPTAQATDIKLKSLSPTSVQVVFTPPVQQPSGYLILRKKDSAPTSTPVDGTVYTKGSDLGDGAVVNAGSTSTITDTGLTALTKYYYAIFSFNGSGNQIKYLVANPLSGNITTFASEPSGQPASITFSNVATTGLKVSYSAPATVPTGYLVLRNPGAAATAVVPEDGVTYSAGATLGTANVAYSGTALSFDDTSLAPGTNYFYQVIAYNGTGETINYLTAAPLTGSQYTLFTEPSAQPASLTFTEVTTTSFTVNYSAAAGSTSGYIAIKKAGSAPTGNPEDGKVYKSGDVVGDGAVAYVGSNLSFTEPGLTAGTSYFYRIYSYSGQSTGTNYLQTAPLSGTGSTLAIEPTSAPTALSFTNVTTSSFSVTFTAPATAPSGYLVIRKIGSAPTTSPVDGNTYNEGTALGDGLVTFVGNATTFNQTLLEKNLTYHYKIFAFNGSGSSTNYLQNSALSGSQLVPLDITGPLFSANTTVQESAANTAVNVSLTVTDPDTPVTSALISYGPSGSSAFTVTDAAMTSAGSNVWTFIIPANAVANPGVRYRVKANNEYGLSSVSEGYFIGISITGEGLPIPYTNPGTTIEAYTIISIPLKLPSNAVDAVFGPALGQYGDKNKWRMFHYQNGQTIELSGSSKLELGKGYWLISSEPATLSTGPGSTNGSADKPVTIALNNGWNQIGNPYTYRINWQDVLNDPANAGNTFQNTLRIFTAGAFTNGTGLNPFQGGFVFVNSGNKLTYPAAEKGNRVAVEEQPASNTSGWILPLQLSNSRREIKHSGIGMRSDAAEGFDRYDDFTLPRMSEYVELNHKKVLHRANYTRDVVPVSDQREWSFEIASSENGEWHQLKWPVADFVDARHELVLWDARAGKPVDMKHIGEYTFRAPATMQILYGDEAYIKEWTRATSFILHEPRPNPTDGIVQISFVIPEEQSGEMIELQLMDQQGRLVGKALKGRYEAGYHEVELTGLTESEVEPNGLYLLRCTTGAVIDVRKVVLRR